MPVTTPVPDPIVAFVVTLLLQKPPPNALNNVVVAETHTVAVPVIDGGLKSTFTTLVV